MQWYIWFIVVAFAFYSWAVWGAYVERELCSLFVWLFMAGFVCDVIGTMPIIIQTDRFSTHAVFGVAALIIMGLHASWARLSLNRSASSPPDRLFHIYSPWAYGLWVVTLISGGFLHWMGR